MIDRELVLTKSLETAAAAATVVMLVYGESDLGVELKGRTIPSHGPTKPRMRSSWSD